MSPPQYLTLDELNPQVELASYYQNERDQWHHYANPGHHLLLPVTGRIEAVTSEERFVALPGDLICFRPAASNQYGVSGTTRFFQIHLALAPPPRHLQALWLEGIGPLPARMALGSRRLRVRELFETVCLVIESSRAADRLRVRSAVEEILALAVDALSGQAGQELRADPWQLVRQRLEGELQREIPVSRLAKEMGISVDHFIRCFRARFGVSPKRYRTLARLRWAAQRLRTGSEPVKRIASAVGVSDATAFTRLFRRHFGVAPSEMALQGVALERDAGLPGSGGLVMNRHLLRPQTPADWQRKFTLRGSRP
jgi:AraC-like DNA-binding protein